MDRLSQQYQFRTKEGPVLLVVLLVCLILGGLLESRDRTRQEITQRAEASRVGIETLQAVNDWVTRMALGLSRLTTTAEVLQELDLPTFETIAKSIMFDVDLREAAFGGRASSIFSISHAPDQVVDKTYPRAPNQDLIGLDYRELPDQYKDIAKTLVSFGPVLSHPFDAVQGRTAIAIREAVRDSRGEPTGLVSIAVDLDAFLSNFRDNVLEEHGYLLEFGIGNSPFVEDLGLQDKDPVILDLRTYGLSWTLALAPIGEWTDLPLVTPTRIGLPVATFFLLWAVHLRFVRHQRSRQIVERLEKGLDALSAAFVIYDKDDRLLHWNDTYPALFGYGDMVKIGMTHEDILRMGLARGLFRVPKEEEEAWVQENLERHRLSDYAIEIELSNGKWIRAMSRKTEGGDRVGVRFDVTDLKHAQISSERSSAAKSEFIALVSHELRTPLTVILGFGKLLRHKLASAKTPPDPFVPEAVGRIVEAGEGLLSLVNSMLDYINLKSGTLKKNSREFVLGDAMARAMSSVQAAAAEKSILLKLEESQGKITGDQLRLEQVLEQLLSNAVKFTDHGGTVSLRAEIGSDAVKISVADTGPGIPEDKLDTIFDEFSQLQPSGTRREGGTGLGLAIARRLARFQDGEIFVTTVLGEGSVFTLILPR